MYSYIVKYQLVILLFVIISIRSLASEISFDKMTLPLPHSNVLAINQDKQGFIWFGTRNGLNRYDGVNLLSFYHNDADSLSLINNLINTIEVGDDSILWIGTYEGLSLFDPKQFIFHSIDYYIDNVANPFFGSVVSIEKGANGEVWIGTIDNGLFRVDIKNKTLNQFRSANRSQAICNDWVNALKYDRKGRLWIGTKNGLSLIENGKVTRNFANSQDNKNSLSNNYITAIEEGNDGTIWIATRSMGLHKVVENGRDISFRQIFFYNQFYSYEPVFNVLSLRTDKYGKIWIGTENGGLFVFNPTTGITEHFVNDPFNPKSVTGNSIYNIFQSEDGIIWVGTYNQGVCFYDENKIKFQHYYQNSTASNFLNCNIIKTLKYLNGELIIGTDGGGLTYYNPASGTYRRYTRQPNSNSISSNTVMSMLPEGDDKLWIGSWESGLDVFSKRTGFFRHYDKSTDGNTILNIEHVTSFLRDKTGRVWIGTFSYGLNYYSPENDKIMHLSGKELGIPAFDIENIHCMLETSSGDLLMGTMDGLYRLSGLGKELKLTRYQYDNKDLESLSNNLVVTLYEDHLKQIWIGTIGGGINLFNPETEKFKRFSVADGLPENSIRAIIADKKQNIWISTNIGIASINPGNFEIKSYLGRTLQSIGEFQMGSATLDYYGNLYFGGSNGVIKFHPDQIKENKNIPKIYFSDFRLFNKSVGISEKSILKKHISLTQDVTLNHSQSVISIDFVALNYTEPSQNLYSYYLEGFESDWNHAGKVNSATYTNLDPGKYVFKVKASNNDGIWNPEPTILNITVKAPMWATWWAFAGYIILLSAIFYLISKLYQKRLIEKELLRNERIQNQNIQDLKDRKLQFFTNISHEIRTPLSMIISPLEEVLEIQDLNNDVKKKVRYASENSKLLLKLINQLLDLRKLDNSKMGLFLSKADLNKVIGHIVELHQLNAEEKKIELIFEPLDSDSFFYFDIDKIEKIVNNLLSNAIKFSSGNSLVFIRITQRISPQKVSVEVIDNGIGIDKNQIPLIFERFYQGKSALNKGGTGIGLALCKELAEVHKGELEVESNDGSGSCFRLNFPADINVYSGMENVTIEESIKNFAIENEDVITDEDEDEHSGNLKYSLVIVEDDPQIRNYLEEEFSGIYNTHSADNGISGQELINKLLPDVVVSDILMPGIDGLELCKRVKSKIETSHIPVILLTAKIEIEDQIKGLEIGADAYVPKPFNMRFLKVLVKNTLEKRSNMYRSFSQKNVIIPSEFSTNKIDEEFLKKVIQYIETNIENTELTVDLLAQNMNLSRSQVYRKIKALTDLTANEFIRQIRLKKALQLLSEGSLNISEIAYSVGFSSQSYFTRSFKEYYGKSPSDLKGQSK